jgi:hypothetical protein
MTEQMERTSTLQLTPGGEPQKHIMKSMAIFEFKKLSEDGQKIKLEVGAKGAVITHDEHAKVILNEGVYYKTNQMEFDPFNNTVSYIFD